MSIDGGDVVGTRNPQIEKRVFSLPPSLSTFSSSLSSASSSSSSSSLRGVSWQPKKHGSKDSRRNKGDENATHSVSVPPTLTAVDRDGGSVYGDVSHILSPFNFAFSDFPFEINRTTGSVTLKNVVDFEAGQEEQIS